MTCDAHFLTWPSFSSQKSCVKIWLGLVEPFKSYHGNRQKKKITDAAENNTFGKIIFVAEKISIKIG